jgi:hypothetical protein
VILSAGSINSPKILELSGIGSKSVLERLGIDVKVASEYVGADMKDHPFVPLYFSVDASLNATWDGMLRNKTLFAQELHLWNTRREGILTDPAGSTWAFLRLPPAMLEQFGDPSSGPGSAHIELLYCVCHTVHNHKEAADPTNRMALRHLGQSQRLRTGHI